MIFLVCSCGLTLRATGEHSELDSLIGPSSDWYPNKYPCARMDCKGPMSFVEQLASEDLPKLEVIDLTVQEVFSALHGLGLPNERDCGEAALRGMSGKLLEAIDAAQIRGSNRSVVYSFKFADGTRLFLGGGAEGAVAYRIAKPRSFANEVLGEFFSPEE